MSVYLIYPPSDSLCWYLIIDFTQNGTICLVGKSVWNPAKFCNYSDSGPFELWNLHWNFIFPIVKCVPANSEHVSSGSESSPTINSSDFMNRKTFLPFVFFWPTKMTSTCSPQPVDQTMLNRMDVNTIPGKAIWLPI